MSGEVLSGAALKQKLSARYQLAEAVHQIGEREVIIFSVGNSYDLLEKISADEFREDEKMPYWAEVWASSIALARYAASALRLQGVRCLELGAGVGAVSVSLAAQGADVVATDYFEDALDFIRLNAETNLVPVETRWLDWRGVTLPEKFEFIFAADVLYERRNHLPVLEAIEKLLAPHGTAFVADPQRAVAENFLVLARENNFSIETDLQEIIFNDMPQTVAIHGLRRPD
ncbi:MAG: methyltransferase domain-containing protein [Rhizobacter sp.]|nr:methyltransferase domain-containing protein [Chlorobiales bacterium]